MQRKCQEQALATCTRSATVIQFDLDGIIGRHARLRRSPWLQCEEDDFSPGQ